MNIQKARAVLAGTAAACFAASAFSFLTAGCSADGPTVAGKQAGCQKPQDPPKASRQPCTPQQLSQGWVRVYYLRMSDGTRQQVTYKTYSRAASGDAYDPSSRTITEENGDTVDNEGHVSVPVHVDDPVEVHPVVVDR